MKGARHSSGPWNWDVLWNSSFSPVEDTNIVWFSRVKQQLAPKGYLFQNKMDGDESLVVLQKQLMINSTTHLNPFSLQHSKHSSRDPCPAMRMEMLTRLILGVFWFFFQWRMERAGKWMMRLFFELGLFAI